jgi:hypothetical protein
VNIDPRTADPSHKPHEQLYMCARGIELAVFGVDVVQQQTSGAIVVNPRGHLQEGLIEPIAPRQHLDRPPANRILVETALREALQEWVTFQRPFSKRAF